MTARRSLARKLTILSLAFLSLWVAPVPTRISAAGTVRQCMNIQLNIQAVQESGAAGHLGVMYRIQNLWGGSCSLSGFPGVVLMDSRFVTLPTYVTWSSNLAGHHPVQVVDLAPHGVAYFALEWAEIPTGNQTCPAARYLLITAPNDKLPVVIYARYSTHPCGGRITASPVVASPLPI